MPVTPTYPGVYIEEVPSGVKTIVGVATSITAFLGRAARGPTQKPIRIANFGDFERKFGGLSVDSTMSYAVQHFFLNGGNDAVIVRVANELNAAKANVAADSLTLLASGEGKWGNELKVRIDHKTRPPLDGEDEETLFNMFVHDAGTKSTESFLNLSTNPNAARFAELVVNEQSQLVGIEPETVPETRPGANDDLDPVTDNPFDPEKEGYYYSADGAGADGTDIRDEDITGNQGLRKGIYALEDQDLFNILCIPPISRKQDILDATYGEAAGYCMDRRAFLIVDAKIGSPNVEAGVQQVEDFRDAIGLNKRNAGYFFPRLKMGDPLKQNQTQEFAPSGAMAGIMARTDLSRGVWKSPAGIEAALVGVREFTAKLTDDENGRLNPLGANCLRNFPVYGNVVWGSRTLDGADQLASEWKYLAVRRFTLFIEESLYRGTQWVVFEPNDEPLWAQIRLNVGAFMQSLFRQGAFQGRSPKEAYFVKCGSDTTTQPDINRGIVNIEVGFAPLKPAEFVIIKIQQMAGKIDT